MMMHVPYSCCVDVESNICYSYYIIIIIIIIIIVIIWESMCSFCLQLYFSNCLLTIVSS